MCVLRHCRDFVGLSLQVVEELQMLKQVQSNVLLDELDWPEAVDGGCVWAEQLFPSDQWHIDVDKYHLTTEASACHSHWFSPPWVVAWLCFTCAQGCAVLAKNLAEKVTSLFGDRKTLVIADSSLTAHDYNSAFVLRQMCIFSGVPFCRCSFADG